MPTVQGSNSTKDNIDLQEGREEAINVLLGTPQQLMQKSLEESSDLNKGELREHLSESNEIEATTENEDNEINGSSNVQDGNIISESSGQTDQMS